MYFLVAAVIIATSIGIVLTFAIKSGKNYTNKLNQKLAILLDDAKIDAAISGGSRITGIYDNHPITFAWFFPGWSSTGDSRIKLSIEIQDLRPGFVADYGTSQNTGSYNQELSHGLSEILSLEKISFANQILIIEMSWSRLDIGPTFPLENSQPFGTLSPTLLSTDFIAAEVKKTLKTILETRE